MIDKVTETEAQASPGGTEWPSADIPDGGTSAPEAPPAATAATPETVVDPLPEDRSVLPTVEELRNAFER